MKLLKNPYHIFALILCGLSFNYGIAQKKDFSKDTLRIKVYTEIEYVEGRMQNAEVTKVFCDYCTLVQMEALKEQAKSIIYREKRYWSYGKVNDIQKLTLIISVSRKDLAAIKNDNDDKEN